MDDGYVKRRIKIPDDYTFEDLRREIENGGRFIMFPYTISILAMPLSFFSPAILVKKGESIRKYQWRYNLISSIFGWWGIILGPLATVKSIRSTCKGGVDVTDDVMLNLNQEGFDNRQFEWKQTNQLFCKIGKWDKKEFVKALSPVYEQDSNIRKIVIGYYIGDDSDENIYYIGLKCVWNFKKYNDIFGAAIYTRFRENTIFFLLDLDEDNFWVEYLLQQGDVIVDKTVCEQDNL